MEAISKAPVLVDLKKLRDSYITVEKASLGATEEEQDKYVDGVLDMYNGFVKSMQLKVGIETEVAVTVNTQ